MKTLLILAVVCLGLSAANATITNLSDCQSSTVQAAVNAASPGDTLVLPSCSGVTWTGTSTTAAVAISGKALTLKGQTTCTYISTAYSNTTPNACTDSTNITMSGLKVFMVSGSATNFVTISNITFTISSSSTTPNNDINLSGPLGQSSIRMHDVHIINNTSNTAVLGAFWGLIDHVLYESSSGGAFVDAYGDFSRRGTDSWNFPQSWGDANATFVEDCKITISNGTTEGMMDAYSGARAVVRHNVVSFAGSSVFGSLGGHGTDSGSLRSAMTFEVYNNHFTNNSTVTMEPGRLRGGTALWHDNTYDGGSWHDINLFNYRSCNTTDISTWQPCNGTNWQISTDFSSNVSSGGFNFCSVSKDQWCSTNADCPGGESCTAFFDDSSAQCRDQPGRTHNQVLGPSGGVRAWNNGTISMVDQCPGNATFSTTPYTYTTFTYPHPLQGAISPTIAQWASCPSTWTSLGHDNAIGGTAGGVYSYTCSLPNGAQAGNTIISCFSFTSNAPTTSITDNNGGNTWSLITPRVSDGTRAVECWQANSVQAGTRAIKLNLGGPNNSVTQVFGSSTEFYNTSGVAAGKVVSNHTTGNTITAGSLTPAANGDMLYQFTASWGNTAAGLWTPGPQSNITWGLLGTDPWLQGTQYGIYNNGGTPAAITPTITGPTGTYNWISIAFDLAAANQGNAPPPGIRIFGNQHNLYPGTNSNSVPVTPSPLTVNFPCQGNLLYGSLVSGGEVDLSPAPASNLTGVTFNPTGNFVQVNPPGDTGTHAWYAPNVSTCANSQQITYHFCLNNGTSCGAVSSLGSFQDTNIQLYDIVGAATAPFDKDATATGDQTSTTGTLNPTVSITPSSTNGLVIASEGQAVQAMVGSVGSCGTNAQLFDSTWWGDESYQNNDARGWSDENNGWAHCSPTSASAISFGFTEINSSTPAGFWAARADAYIASGVVSFTLSVSNGNQGFGSVTSSDGLINCGATCSANYISGSVTLTATTNISGMLFTGWTVDGSNTTCPGRGTCTVSMTANHSVTANFVLGIHAPTKGMFSFR